MNRMSRLLILALAWACLFCGTDKPAPEPPTLQVFTWSDYHDPELVKAFEAKFNCKVRFTYFESNEQMLAKVKAGGAAYDVLYPSSYAVKQLLAANLLQPLDHALIPNLKNVDPTYLPLIAEADMKHSVPYMVSTTGIGYLAELGDLEHSWKVLGDPALKGRVTLLNDMRETLGSALKFHGYSLNSTDDAELAEAAQTVIAWKRNAAKFESVQYHYGLASGEFKMVMGYSGDVLQSQGENPAIRFMLPEEGFAFTCDQLVVPKGAPHPELAHAWINYLHEADVAARNTESVKFLCPNTAAYPLLSESLRSNPAVFPPAEVLARAEYVEDLGADLAKYTRVWDEIKAAP